MTLGRKRKSGLRERVGAPRAAGLAAAAASAAASELKRGRGGAEWSLSLPPDLTPDPRAADRACSLTVSFRVGGDYSSESKEEAQAARPCSGAHHPKVRHVAPNGPLKSRTVRAVVLQPDPLTPVPGSERPTLPVV